MICTNCRHENESNSTFCTKCGRSLLNDRLMADENTLELLEKRITLIENLLSKYITEGILSKEELDSITDTGISINDEAEINIDISSSLQSDEMISNQSNIEEVEEYSFEKEEKTPLQTKKPTRIKWDQFLGLNWLAIIGGLAMLFSLGIFSFAFYETVSPIVRFIFGSFVGLGFIVLGVTTQIRYGFWSQVITGVGLSIMYLSSFAAFGIWNLFNPLIGLIILGAIGLSGWMLSIKSEGMWIAILGIIGVFISPFLIDISDKDIDLPLLIIYLIIMDLSVLAISMKRNWRVYNQISLWGSYLFLYHSMVNLGLNELWLCLVALSVVHIIFIGVTTIFHIVRNSKPEFQDFLLVISNSVLFFFICGDLLESDYSGIFATISISLALINGILSLLIFRTSINNRTYSILFAVKASVFLAASIPIYFSDAYTTITWAIMGSGVTLLGLQQHEWKWRLYSSILLTLSIGNFIITDLWADIPYGIPLGLNIDNWLINTRTITGSLIAITLWITYLFYIKNPWNVKFEFSNDNPSPTEDNSQTNFAKLFHTATTALTQRFSMYELWRPLALALSGTMILWVTILVHIGNSPSEEQLKAIITSIATATYGIILVLLAVWKNNPSFRVLGTILIFIASVLSVTLVPILPDLPPNMWISATFFSFIFTTILLLMNIILQNLFYISTETRFRELNFLSKLTNRYSSEISCHLLGISTLIAISYELSYQWDKVGISFYRLEDLAFTFLLGIYGFLIYIFSNRYLQNLYYSKISYQMSGLLLFSIASVKFLTFDMIEANNASILYEWDGFLWLKGFAFIPLLNPYFLLAISLLFFGAIILKETVKNKKVNIYNWQNFYPAPYIAFFIGVIILVTGTREIIQWFYHAPFNQPPIILSIYWTIYSLSLVGIGIKSKNQKLRLLGFGILSVPIIKIFFWDTWKTDPIIGFLGLFIFGSILLGTSFIYQRNKEKIRGFLYGEENFIEEYTD